MNEAIQKYLHFVEDTDVNDPIVVEECRKHMRQSEGTTDVHYHMSRFRKMARGQVMEIGVRYGASTSAFLTGLAEHGGHLFSVDINDCNILPKHPQWTFIQADSITESGKVLKIIPAELDLLFIDGDHTHEGALSDLRNYGPLAKIVMVHDTNLTGPWKARAAVETYMQNSRQKNCIYYTESHGLAVLS